MSRPQPDREHHDRFCAVERWERVRDDGAAMRSPILRDQLDVTSDEFWSCVLRGLLPGRGVPELPKEALPADLVYLLIHRVGLAESTVAAMSKEEAVARLQRYWADGT